MEPQVPKVRFMLSPEIVHSIDTKDGQSLVAQLGKLIEVNSPTATWAEAIGTRLQIRDFLLQQKGNLAALQTNQDPDIRQNVTNYLHIFDADLTSLTGQYGQDRPPLTPHQLKSNRLSRLTQLPTNKLMELASGFSYLTDDRQLGADDLIQRTVNIRNDVVEQLWSAAQSYNEGDIGVAQKELEFATSTVNDNIDIQISTILAWEEVES
jgi:hypothetical protein